jgi:hypothetical protein
MIAKIKGFTKSPWRLMPRKKSAGAVTTLLTALMKLWTGSL